MEDLGTFALVGTLQRKLREKFAGCLPGDNSDWTFHLSNGQQYIINLFAAYNEDYEQVEYEVTITHFTQRGAITVGNIEMCLVKGYSEKRFYNALAHITADFVLSHNLLEGGLRIGY